MGSGDGDLQSRVKEGSSGTLQHTPIEKERETETESEQCMKVLCATTGKLQYILQREPVRFSQGMACPPLIRNLHIVWLKAAC